MTTWNQWIPLLGIFAIVAGLYHLGRWFDGIADRGARSKGRRIDRKERRRNITEELEDELWEKSERERIKKRIKKEAEEEGGEE